MPDSTQTVLMMSLPSEWQCAHPSLSVLFTSLTTHGCCTVYTPLLQREHTWKDRLPLYLEFLYIFFVNDSAFSRPGLMKHKRRLFICFPLLIITD